MTPKPEIPSDNDRKVSAEDVVEEAAFYRRLFESNDPTTAMLRDSLSRSTDANHLQHLIRLHSSGSNDSQTVTSQIFMHAPADLPGLMPRSADTEHATQANLAAMTTFPKEATKELNVTGTPATTLATTNVVDTSKVQGSAFFGAAKGAAKPALLETKKGGGDAEFVRDFMKQAKDAPKLNEKEKDLFASFIKSIRKDGGMKEGSAAEGLARDPSAVYPPAMAGIDTEDKELFRQFMLNSIGMRSMGANNNSTDFTSLLQESVSGENEFLKFMKTFDARQQTEENGESPFQNFMKSVGWTNAGQSESSKSTDMVARNASLAFMGSMLKSTDFSTDVLKALESSKTFGGISPQGSIFYNAQDFLPRGVSLEMEQRFRSALLSSQSSSGDAWELQGRQISGASMVSPMLGGRVQLRPNWHAFNNTMLAANAVLPRPPLYNGGDHSAAEAAMALASMQPREEEMLRRQNVFDDKPKRKRQRKIHEPAQKAFVEVNSNDVLFGRYVATLALGHAARVTQLTPSCSHRGGRTNHHPGNKMYLELKEILQERYREADKNEKTKISQELVDLVHQRGGRFLKLENGTEDSWYEVLNITARKKASQTLREVNTPDERAKKRARYAK